jgi:Phasin protein/Hemerythrin HHE cation binding domain
MNIRQAMQAGPAKANELFAKLSDTSNGAVKTRDRIFAELKSELELLVDLEERHLLPLLGKHKETKDLVPEALKNNKELRAQLKELDGLPKHEDAFVQKLSDLQKGFQQHVRDSRKELLPAVQKVLSEEEANSAAEGIEAGRAEAEQAKRDETERARAGAREEREKAERQAAEAEQAKREETERARVEAREERERTQRLNAGREAAERSREVVERATQETAREAARTLEQTADAARSGSRRIVEGLTETAQRTTASIQDTAETYRETARSTALDLQAATAASQVTVNGMLQMQAEGRAWLGRAVNDGVRASGALMRCTSPKQFAETQREFLAASMRNWMESGTRILQISQRMAGEAVPTLQARLDAGSGSRQQGDNAQR